MNGAELTPAVVIVPEDYDDAYGCEVGSANHRLKHKKRFAVEFITERRVVVVRVCHGHLKELAAAACKLAK